MAVPVTPRLIHLTYEAALKVFWRKKELRRFLRSSYVSEKFLSTWAEDESKRELLDRLFNQLQNSERGRGVIRHMAQNLSEYQTFPDLRGWEDSDQKIQDAHKAVAELKKYLKDKKEEEKDKAEKEEVRRRAEEAKAEFKRAETDKDALRARLDALNTKVGTQEGGYEFESWFFDLLDFCEIQNRRPYKSGGRQIDGSLTVEGTTHLVELKFTSNQVGAEEIDSLRAKVEDKAENTMGVMLSVSGYSKVAIEQASGRRTTTLLLDASHLYMFLTGAMELHEIICRVRRHAAQTGEAFLPPGRFGG